MSNVTKCVSEAIYFKFEMIWLLNFGCRAGGAFFILKHGSIDRADPVRRELFPLSVVTYEKIPRF